MLVAEFGKRANNLFQLLASIVLFVLVLFITYMVTKWIGNYQAVQMKDKNMQVVETMRITNGKCIQIIKIVDRYIVVAVCKDTVTFLTELDGEEAEKLVCEESVETEGFQDILNKIKTKKK